MVIFTKEYVEPKEYTCRFLTMAAIPTSKYKKKYVIDLPLYPQCFCDVCCWNFVIMSSYGILLMSWQQHDTFSTITFTFVRVLHWKCRTPIVTTYMYVCLSVCPSIRLSTLLMWRDNSNSSWHIGFIFCMYTYLISRKKATLCFSAIFNQSFRSYEHFTDFLCYFDVTG